MPENLLKNEGFEADWDEDRSHRCLIIPEDAGPYEKDVGNIFVPPGWLFWFHHDPGTWDQPEGRDSWKTQAPERVHGGEKAFMWFTFNRRHDAGLLQQVGVPIGSRLRFTAWLHAWSNHYGEDFPHPNDGLWSEGAGYDQVAWEAGTQPHDTGEAQQDAKANFTFQVGIDPTGGTNPLADTVVWGKGYHIYNGYVEQLEAEATTQSDTVTVFIRSKTLWAFKHNDAYVDDAELIVVGTGGVVPEVRLSHRPGSPKVGDAVTIEARSSASLTNVGLVVTQPSGAELPQGGISVGHDRDWRTWTCTTSPTGEAGRHTIRFSADDGVVATTAFDCAPEVQLSRHPDSPKVGEAMTVEVRSLAGLTNVGLAVTQPSGAKLTLAGDAIGRDGEWYTWTFTTAPAAEAGRHTVRFSADGGVEETMAFDCAEAPPPPPPPSQRGLPREQYARTYVLLPPDAGVDWALAVVEGSWEERRYTIGGSADDAGIGDLDVRRVVAVNPGKWPDDLQAFLQKHYPGVEYIAVEADTPAELAGELKHL